METAIHQRVRFIGDKEKYWILNLEKKDGFTIYQLVPYKDEKELTQMLKTGKLLLKKGLYSFICEKKESYKKLMRVSVQEGLESPFIDATSSGYASSYLIQEHPLV